MLGEPRPDISNPGKPVELWKVRKLTLEERATEIEQFERELRSQTLSLYMRYGIEYLLWFIVGVSLLFWSFHTTDTRYAGLCFYGGLGLGDAGMLWTLIRARHDAERRGLF